jgi:hypothetical protein
VSSFTEIFTASVVSPSQVSYTSYTISSNLTLAWPFEKNPLFNTAAAITDIISQAPSLSVSLPDASLVSVGQGIVFRNQGGNTFGVLDAAGNTVASVASGTSWFVFVTDNTTEGGVWGITQFGAATSSANAATLAGAGLQAALTLLNQNLTVNAQISNYAPGPADRATVIRNTGGAVTYQPAQAGSASNQLPLGWFVYIINNGSGSLVFAPQGSQTVDGESTKTLAPTESAVFFSDGANFWTLGYGRSIVNTVTATNISLPPAGEITLSGPQAAAQVQNFTGALSDNVTVTYGTGAGFWFIWNNTTGAHNVTFRVNSADAGVVVSQGSFSIIRSDGSNMHIAFTATSGTVTQVNTTSDLTGGPITSTGTLGLSNTGVTAGTYGDNTSPDTVPIVTVDAKGRITAMGTYDLGTMADVNVGNVSGDLPVLGTDNNFPSLNGGVPCGAVLAYSASTAPAGYILGFGTIGNASSGASNRANDDQINLFTLIWNNWADAQAPVSGGRGVSALADWNANKTIAAPDLRGCVIAGLDNMGGVAAGRITTTVSPDGNTMGAGGGAQTQIFAVSGSTSGSLGVSVSVSVFGSGTTGQSGDFRGKTDGGTAVSNNTHSHGFSVSSSGSGGGSTSGALSVSGATDTRSILQPTRMMTLIVKY